MRKYTQTEKTEVLSPDGHQEVGERLNKLGKTSASELSDEERETIFEDSLDFED